MGRAHVAATNAPGKFGDRPCELEVAEIELEPWASVLEFGGNGPAAEPPQELAIPPERVTVLADGGEGDLFGLKIAVALEVHSPFRQA